MTIPNGTLFGRYEIQSPIGAGGMGEVYLAQDVQLRRPVAIKLLPAEFTRDEDRLRRFQQEARATSALNHPNILTIYEIGETTGAQFIAMEFIEGLTLRERLDRGALPVKEALDIALQVASALAAAHAYGIIHRDVKPENIMLRRDGYVKVLDFGLAKLTERHFSSANEQTMTETTPGSVIGTVTYMSPEQARGLKVDERTDIFSLGVVLYEMLTGRPPFAGATPSDVIVSILDREPLPLEKLLPQVSPELKRIIQTALAKEKEARYQAITDLGEDLRRLKQRLDFEAELQRTTPPGAAPDDIHETNPQTSNPTVSIKAFDKETGRPLSAATVLLDPQQSSTPEIAHVLFMDLVEFSKHWTSLQPQIQTKLTEIVSHTDEFGRAQAINQLICKSTGDGMLLAFFGDPEAPVRCALEISRALLSQPDLQLRMGINSGPVYRTLDVNKLRDVAGSGVNMAQRVMDCGDAGHILLSKTYADFLLDFGDRQERMDDLGEVVVKHGARVHLFNLYTDTLGNPRRPSKVLLPPATHETTSGARHPIIDSLAVLPLVNASTDASMEYLSDGITESIINTLSQLPQLRVMARATVFRYKGKEVDPQEVRRELGVRAVMMGRVLLIANRLLIKIELIDTSDGSQLWGEQYKREPQDIFEVQEEISKEVSEKLRIKLTGEEKRLLAKRYTDNTAAYELYLKGRYFLSKATREDIHRGISYFQRAIDFDPSYALAYAGIADAYYGLSSAHLPPHEAMPKAREAALKALEIDDSLAEAHASLGLVKAFFDWNWAGAESEYKRAIELNPGHASAHHWYGWYLALMGRLDEAIAEVKKAYELDPLSLEINSDLGLSFFFARQYDEAIEQFKKAAMMDKDNIWTCFFLAWAYEQLGDFDKAIAEFKDTCARDDSPLVLGGLGHAYVLAGRREEAERVLDEMQEISRSRHVAPYLFAIIYTALGQPNEAFAWLERAYEDRTEALAWLKVDPRLDPLRTDPRFISLMRRVGLPL